MSKQVNRRLYECEECQDRRMVAWVELNRASPPRCMKCGSARLELVSDKAKDDQLRLNEQRLEGETPTLKLSPQRKNKFII